MRNPLVFVAIAMVGLIAAASNNKKTDAPASPAAVPSKPAIEPATVLYDFTADWCSACKGMEPKLMELEDCGTTVIRVDTDHDRTTGKNYRQSTKLPEYVAVRGGKVIARHVGVTTLEHLKRMVGVANDNEPTPVIAPPKPEPIPAKPVKTVIVKQPGSSAEPVISDKGWKLRLLYPKGDRTAGEIIKLFETKLTGMSGRFGFEAIASSSTRFGDWSKFGFPADRTLLVLVRPDNEIVLCRADAKADIMWLRERIRGAAAGETDIAEGCRFWRK